MSTILGVWGEIPENDIEWHEDRHIPDATKRLGVRTYHFEAGMNAFPEEQRQEATSFTLYEGLQSSGPESLTEQFLAPAASASDVPKDALLEARCFTSTLEHKARGFSGEYTDAGCLVMGIFEPSRTTHDEFFKWWHEEFIPVASRSPSFLRLRLWKLTDAAADLRNGAVKSRERNDLLQYVMVYEFDSEDTAWEIAVEMGQSEGWQKFVEHDMQYKYGLYTLRRIYTKTGEVEAEFNNDDASRSSEEEK